jgi:nucleotide-binding universal stress UspA family protein
MDDQSRIMCAVDLSWRSEGAINYAMAIAKARRAPLDLLFAVSDRRPFGWRVRERVAQLGELRRRISEAGIGMRLTVQHGRPADVILQHARSSAGPPQLIVLGAPGRRRGLDRFRSPSVAQAVVHAIDCPALVVPGSKFVASSVAAPFRRVLCAVDFSPASMSALDEAYRITRREGTTMRLLHVLDIVVPAVPRLMVEFPVIDYMEQLRNGAWHQLHRLLPLSQELYGRVHPHVEAGLVVDQIVRNAQEFDADLVVLGVRRRGRVARLLHSTTGHALQRLNRPVLAVPESTTTVGATLHRVETARIAA